MAPQPAKTGPVANRPFTCPVESIKLLSRICPYPETPPKRRLRDEQAVKILRQEGGGQVPGLPRSRVLLDLSLTTAAAPASPPPKAKFRTIAPSIAFPMFLGMVGETIVATALPVIAASLGNIEQITWVVVAYLIAMAVTAPVYGRLGDAFGRRHMMVVALSISLVGSILCALSTSMGMLIAARVFQGIGGGGLVSLSQALVSQSVQPRDRMRFHGYIAAFGFSASALGPVIGGILTDSFGWQSVFLFNLPSAILGILLVFRVPARTTPFEPFRFDFPGLDPLHDLRHLASHPRRGGPPSGRDASGPGARARRDDAGRPGASRPARVPRDDAALPAGADPQSQHLARLWHGDLPWRLFRRAARR